MKTKIQQYIFKFSNFIIFAFVFSSCAQVVAPSGGPRDIKPPRAVQYVPDSAAVNFNAQNIAIAFNEYISLVDVQRQLIVSPPMKKMPEVTAKGKMIYIELKDTLQKNMTYVINFGSAIRDYTESNTADGFQYIFSTGRYIDSLKLSGTVKNSFDAKTEKGILVMLYKVDSNADDSVPCKSMPSYFGVTKPDGSFKINNIQSGTYKLFALKDANMNYLYDSPEESIAYSDTLLKISKNKSVNLSFFKELPVKQKLKRAFFAERGHMVFSFARSLSDSLRLNFFSPTPKENVIYEYSPAKDTVHYWFADDLKDTMRFQLLQGNIVLDTVKIKSLSLDVNKQSGRGVKMKLNVNVNFNKDKPVDYKNNMNIYFSHPIDMSKSDGKVYLYGGSKFSDRTIKIAAGNKFVSTLSFNDSLRPDSAYHFLIPAGTFTDIFGNKNDSLKIDFKTQEEKFYGTLKMNLKIKNPKTNYIVQLLNEKGGVLKEEKISESKALSYSYLYPGKCTMRLIYDSNGDGKWTTGSYFQHKQPEKIIYYSGDITIRSNWDLELEWKVE